MNGEITIVTVRGMKANTGTVNGKRLVYVGRRCAGWGGSVLGSPFRAVAGKPGATLPNYRRWLWQEMKKQGEVWLEIVSIVKLVESGESVMLGCWCDNPSCCHASVVRAAVLWVIEEEE
ncbi:MAG: DUF4326 domain-containing protein [Anaerolineales bacterium]|nr:DUF4326 domain-containing protein [Anaerolineales bacterium]